MSCAAAHRLRPSTPLTLKAMQIPFSCEQFYGVFRDYNDAAWPAPVFLAALAVAVIAIVAIGLLATARLPHGAPPT